MRVCVFLCLCVSVCGRVSFSHLICMYIHSLHVKSFLPCGKFFIPHSKSVIFTETS